MGAEIFHAFLETGGAGESNELSLVGNKRLECYLISFSRLDATDPILLVLASHLPSAIASILVSLLVVL
jgi:hypothetical protein